MPLAASMAPQYSLATPAKSGVGISLLLTLVMAQRFF